MDRLSQRLKEKENLNYKKPVFRLMMMDGAELPGFPGTPPQSAALALVERDIDVVSRDDRWWLCCAQQLFSTLVAQPQYRV